jgi:hypothetical protein
MSRRKEQDQHRLESRAAGASLDNRSSAVPARWNWSLRARLLASAAIAFHLLAVFIGAWVGSPPTSPLAEELARPFRPYIALADLNHGYRFFAPNPGPSHLLRYRLIFDDGSTQDGYFPNRNQHWPRLLYHRYFMLSENLNAVFPQQQADGGSAPPEQAMAGFRALGRSYAAHILRTSQAKKIAWELVRHYQASPDEVLAGRTLVDDSYYVPVGSGSLSREESP